MTLDEVLYALLFRVSFRRRFIAGERAALGISAVDEDALATLDFGELEQAACLACRSVLERSHRGVGSVLDAFPRSLAAWHEAHPGRDLDDLAGAFADSAAFVEWTPASGLGHAKPLEEVFRGFCEACLPLAAAPVVREECAIALLRALVVNPVPAFQIPPFVLHGPRGFYAVLERDGGPFLVAILDGRLVTGALTPMLGAILRRDPPSTMEDEATARSRETAIRELRAMGLLA